MERRLLNDLFITRDYNKLERPVLNETDALAVKFGLTIQQIIGVVRSCWNLIAVRAVAMDCIVFLGVIFSLLAR